MPLSKPNKAGAAAATEIQEPPATELSKEPQTQPPPDRLLILATY